MGTYETGDLGDVLFGASEHASPVIEPTSIQDAGEIQMMIHPDTPYGPKIPMRVEGGRAYPLTSQEMEELGLIHRGSSTPQQSQITAHPYPGKRTAIDAAQRTREAAAAPLSPYELLARDIGAKILVDTLAEKGVLTPELAKAHRAMSGETAGTSPTPPTDVPDKPNKKTWRDRLTGQQNTKQETKSADGAPSGGTPGTENQNPAPTAKKDGKEKRGIQIRLGRPSKKTIAWLGFTGLAIATGSNIGHGIMPTTDPSKTIGNYAGAFPRVGGDAYWVFEKVGLPILKKIG